MNHAHKSIFDLSSLHSPALLIKAARFVSKPRRIHNFAAVAGLMIKKSQSDSQARCRPDSICGPVRLAKDPGVQSQMVQVMSETYVNLSLFGRPHDWRSAIWIESDRRECAKPRRAMAQRKSNDQSNDQMNGDMALHLPLGQLAQSDMSNSCQQQRQDSTTLLQNCTIFTHSGFATRSSGSPRTTKTRKTCCKMRFFRVH